MTTAAPPRARSGKTAKVSVSLDRADLAFLQKRAKKLHGGNLSAVLAEGVRHIREEEGREALAAWLGDAGDASPEERERLRAEWRTAEPPERRTRRGK